MKHMEINRWWATNALINTQKSCPYKNIHQAVDTKTRLMHSTRMNKNMGNNEDEVQKTVKDTEIIVMMRCYLKKMIDKEMLGRTD